MSDVQRRREAVQVSIAADGDADERVETFELMAPPAHSALMNFPIARTFAFLAGGGLATLGVAGLLPVISANGTLLGLFHVSAATNLVHLATGLAGLAAWRLRRESLVVWYAVALMAIYLWIFSDGILAFGNGVAPAGAPSLVLLGVLPLRDLPLLLANGLHVTLTLGSLLVAGATALQQGAYATAAVDAGRVREYRSHVTIGLRRRAA